jgi:hypothetical protein
MTKRTPATVIDRSDERWHIDRRLPVALIVTLVLTFSGQTISAIWWASKTDQRIEVLEGVSKASVPTSTEQGNRLTRVETKLEAVQDGISEIKSILRKEPAPTKTAR